MRRLGSLFTALPDLGLGAVYLITWIAPYALGRRMVAHLMLVMLLEFIIVHSSGFMGSVLYGDARRVGKVTATLGFGIFYTLFVAGFALAFATWWPIWAFWGLTLNRLLGALVGQATTGAEKTYVQKGWAIGVIFYLAFVFATTLLPVPSLGITSAVRASQHLPGSGLWIDAPHRVIAFGFLYFTSWGISDLYGHRWLSARGLPTGKPKAGTGEPKSDTGLRSS